MSAIGLCVRMHTADLDRCLELATRATPERPSRWPWQPRVESGLEVFNREWSAAILEELEFEGSGYLLSSYFLAQAALNHVPDPFDSPEGKVLEAVFTAAFPARTALALPEFTADALRQFCNSEWGDDGPGMYDGIGAAHVFFKSGLSRVTPDEAVIFIIS